MIPSNPKELYSRFVKGHEGKLHFAAHSHHFWPDCTREAQLRYWDDSATLSDEKWGKIFSEVIPTTQKHIANILNLKHPEQIALAPNTHELSARLLSLFLGHDKLNILTTSSEFHSWRRQFLRLSEFKQVHVQQVDTSHLLEDRSSFLTEMKIQLQQSHDLVFLSQVFFDSGLALTDEELLSLVDASPKETIFVIDGYHGFAALPTNLQALEGRMFYLGGGYKYAQAGEGVGFMVVPKGLWRPAYTGWFAEYGTLSQAPGLKVGYSADAMSFMGATQDPSGFYRFNAVWDDFHHRGMSIQEIHAYVVNLQKLFLKTLDPSFNGNWNLKPLFKPSLDWHGHFLTLEATDLIQAERCQQTLSQNHILIDRRGPRLRIGFGLYQDQQDVLELCHRLNKLAQGPQ